jgi:N-methylhydantoinase B
LNAEYPAAVAAGNVETSTRVVDVVLGALSQAIPGTIPAASHGSMNNLAMGSPGDHSARAWDYYETIGGGMGASPTADGLDAVQTHMTNTLNTPVESLEMAFPVRVRRYQIRRGSGGEGLHKGGCGIVREFEFLQAANATLLTERRAHAPWGLQGGGSGDCGYNRLNQRLIRAKQNFSLQAGDILTIETAGGGGWGKPVERGR